MIKRKLAKFFFGKEIQAEIDRLLDEAVAKRIAQIEQQVILIVLEKLDALVKYHEKRLKRIGEYHIKRKGSSLPLKKRKTGRIGAF